MFGNYRELFSFRLNLALVKTIVCSLTDSKEFSKLFSCFSHEKSYLAHSYVNIITLFTTKKK